MRPRQYVVKLSDEERAELSLLTSQGKTAAARFSVLTPSCRPTMVPSATRVPTLYT